MKLLLEVKDLSFCYPRSLKVLNNINFSLVKGECFCLLGASGSGKSTLGQIIQGFLKPTSGDLIWDKSFLQFKEPLEVYRKKQMVSQDPSSSLSPFYTPYKTLKEVLRFHFDYEEEFLDEKIKNYLELFGIKESVTHQKNHLLSGGEKQRLCLARALSVNPELLILDEPLSSCDPFMQKEILYLLKSAISKLGLSVLIILHDLKHAGFIADRIGFLEDGTLKHIYTKEEFLEKKHTLFSI